MWRLNSVLVLLCVLLCLTNVLCNDCEKQTNCHTCVKLNEASGSPTCKYEFYMNGGKRACVPFAEVVEDAQNPPVTSPDQCPCSELETCGDCAGRKMRGGQTHCVYIYSEIDLATHTLSHMNPKCEEESEEGVSERHVQSSRPSGRERKMKVEEASKCVREDSYFGLASPDDTAANAKPCDIGFGIFSAEHLQHLVSTSFPETHLRGSLLPRFISGDCTPDQMSMKMGEIAKLLSTIQSWPKPEFAKAAKEKRDATAMLMSYVPAEIEDLLTLPDEVQSAVTAFEALQEDITKESSRNTIFKVFDHLDIKKTLKSVAKATVRTVAPSLVMLMERDSITPEKSTGVFKGLTYGHLWRSYQKYLSFSGTHDQLPLPNLNEHVSSSRTMASFDVVDFDDNLVASLAMDIANLATGGAVSGAKAVVDSAIFAAKLSSIADHEKNIQRRSNYIVNMLMSYYEQFRSLDTRVANGMFKPHYSPYLEKTGSGIHYNFARTACEDVYRYCFYLGGIVRARAEAPKNEDYCICLKIDLQTSEAGVKKKGEKCAIDSDCELGWLCQESLCKRPPFFKGGSAKVDTACASDSDCELGLSCEESTCKPTSFASPECPWEKMMQCDKALVEVDKTILANPREESKEARWCAREMESKCLKCGSERLQSVACIYASRRCFERKLKLVRHQTDDQMLPALECDANCRAKVTANCPAACLQPLRFLYFARTHVGPEDQHKVVTWDFFRATTARTVAEHIHKAAGDTPKQWPVHTVAGEVAGDCGDAKTWNGAAFIDLGSGTRYRTRRLHHALAGRKEG